MRIKTEQFCSLATSPSWQAWLFHYDGDIYRRFIRRLQESRGCSENRELMKDLLGQIQKNGGSDAISDFLRKHYPHMIEGGVVANSDGDFDNIFIHYNPIVLTYPRRIIFTGPSRELQKKVREFIIDKIKSDYIILGERAYIEYLEKIDEMIMNKIPLSNWQIAAYRQR